MKEKPIQLSRRLQMIASLVTPGNRLADVGCDHGYLPIYLVQEGSVPAALAMDVRPGPLAAAKEHVHACKLDDYIALRISDGLKAYHVGEADSLVCAGMGGRLMARILSESMDKARSFKECILQPQSELQEFRRFLREAGFRILGEDTVCEDHKYYFAIKAVYDPQMQAGDEALQTIYDCYGASLLTAKHPVLKAFLEWRDETLRAILQALEAEDTQTAGERAAQLREECANIQRALDFYL